MKLYSEHPGASISMGQDAQLENLLAQVILANKISYVVETGTYLGRGSTETIANALAKQASTKVQLHTIEVCRTFHAQASDYLKKFTFAKVHLGLSVRYNEAIEFIQSDPVLIDHSAEEGVYIDDITNPRAFYLREINGQLESAGTMNGIKNPTENILRRLLLEAPSDNPLFVALDSAGGIGWLEFKIVVQTLGQTSYFLLMDDTEHLKHYRSKRYVESDPRFKVLGIGTKRDWMLVQYMPIII